jgi:hypothetical protein
MTGFTLNRGPFPCNPFPASKPGNRELTHGRGGGPNEMITGGPNQVVKRKLKRWKVTYEQVKDLFAKYPVASTWNSANPQALYFDTGQKGNWKSRDLHAPNRSERYIKIPFAEVALHIEKTGSYNSEN